MSCVNICDEISFALIKISSDIGSHTAKQSNLKTNFEELVSEINKERYEIGMLVTDRV